MAKKQLVIGYKHNRGVSSVYRCQSIDELTRVIPDSSFIICDDFFEGAISANFYLKSNEQNKNLEIIPGILEQMLKNGVNRNSTLVTIGGGVIGDIGGYIASGFMRGIRWVNIPTTLLAQVDSCIGGKVGVNTGEGKNLFGSFYQPEEIYLYHDFLSTLPVREINSGWGEILKYQKIDNTLKVDCHETTPSPELVEKCLSLKSKYIEMDELDQIGKRIILNLGHTLGHALEKLSSYEISHGEAVWWGLLFESFIQSHRLCEDLLKFKSRFDSHILQYRSDELYSVMSHDKKGGAIFFNEDLGTTGLSQVEFEREWKEFTHILSSC